MTMSTSTMLCVFLMGLWVVSVQGVTLRLKGREIIPNDGSGEVNSNDLPVGGCRRYESLECLSDVKYRGRKEEAYWTYIEPSPPHRDFRVDDKHCKSAGNCINPDIGWWSTKGIYKKGKSYYGVLRLGRRYENATEGTFSCVFKGDSGPQVSLLIQEGTTSPDPTPTDPTDAVPATATDDQETASPTPSPSPNPSSITDDPLPPVTPTPSPSPDPTNSTNSSGSGFNDS